MRTRQHRIEFYLNDLEYAKADHAAKKDGLTLSEYFRHFINDRIPQDRSPEYYLSTLKELRLIGNNISQIAHVADTVGIIDTSLFDNLYKELIKLILNVIDTAEMPREVKERCHE